MNVILGILPDIILSSDNNERPYYSSNLMQTAFHELAHAAHYRAVGNDWWITLGTAELFPNGNCGGYGCGTGDNDGLVAVAESWAEFIGTNHALRRYPNGQKRSRFFQTPANPDGLVRFDVALEYENWFRNDWIPTGIYNDLRDNFNFAEDWDNVQGATIQQLFSPFAPDIRTMCDYYARFTQLYWSQFGFQPVLDIFTFHQVNCVL